jgi:hypothetical protein
MNVTLNRAGSIGCAKLKHDESNGGGEAQASGINGRRPRNGEQLFESILMTNK